ncbi:MAG: mechanosensitive ion channel [Lachnospiraceae bacterium]|nr:mechanosensitive ion channel [Lachnospiraceae bacterium]
MGVQPAAFVTVLASAGVAIGLALQGSLSNIAGGCLILLTRPFIVGDYIVEDGHGNEGTVMAIDLFYTRIKTTQNKIIVVPNGVISSNSLTNVTRQEELLLDIRVGIGYDDDLLKAKEILKEVAATSDFNTRVDEVTIFVDELGESSINLGVRFWVPSGQYHPARWDTNERIKLALDKEGINIPYNQLDVHMINN